MKDDSFEWDEEKAQTNLIKHGLTFAEGTKAFLDKERIIHRDPKHSMAKFEERYYCFGKVNERVLTVRFTYRNDRVRIFGVAEWRKGRKIYEKENKKI